MQGVRTPQLTTTISKIHSTLTLCRVNFRPHTLRIVSSSNGEYADNGDWIEGSNKFSNPIPCRYEQNGKAQTIIQKDGKSYIYSLVVYLDLSDVDFPYGTTVQLFDRDGTKTFEKPIQGFRKGQLNMTIWL